MFGIDKETRFSNNQSLISAAADIDSEVVLNKGAVGGPYNSLWLFVKTGPDAFVGVASTVEFKLRTSDDNFAASDKILFSTGPLAVTELTANTVVAKAAVPLGVLNDLKMEYTIVGAAGITTGAVYAALVPMVREE